MGGGVTAANDRITLFVAFNYGGRAEIVDAARSFGGTRGRVPRPPLRARDERPRPADPDQRRAAAVQLPALAVRLLGARLSRRAVARLRPRALEAALAEYDEPRAAVAGGRMNEGRPERRAVRRRARLRASAASGRPAPPLPPPQGGTPAGAAREGGPPKRQRSETLARIARSAALDRRCGHDRDRRRRAVRRGDDRLRLGRDRSSSGWPRTGSRSGSPPTRPPRRSSSPPSTGTSSRW